MGNKPSTEAPYRDPGLLSTYEGFTGPITDNKSGTKIMMAKKGAGAEAPEKTLPQLIEQAVAAKPNVVTLRTEFPCPPMEGGRAAPPIPLDQWKSWTLQQYYDEVRSAAKAFMALGLEPKDAVAIYGFNCPEWFFSEVGAIYAGGIAAGIYPTDTPAQVAFKIKHSAAVVACVENADKAKMILSRIAEMPKLKAIVVWGPEEDPSAVEALGKGTSMTTLHWSTLAELGAGTNDKLLQARVQNQKANECCAYIYTSGTTGFPKAVMISHDNIIFETRAALMSIQVCCVAPEEERIISYLPLSHVAGMMVDIIVPLISAAEMAGWMSVNFARVYDLKASSIVERFSVVRPTMFLGVPRVWEKIQAKMIQKKQAAIESGEMSAFAQSVSEWGKKCGREYARASQMGGSGSKDIMYGVADALVHKKVKGLLGLDKCKYAFTGAAPISVETLEYFASVGIWINEVYGMSECTGAATWSTDYAHIWGSCGWAVPGVEVKVFKSGEGEGSGNVEVSPAKDIMHPTDGEQGELCYRGRNIMMGYLANPDLGADHMEEIAQKTRETVDDEGWLHSGDKGCVDARGMFRVTGRYKELLIGAGGENIAPVPIEDNIKKLCPAISNVMMVGDKKPFNCMLVTLKTKGATGEVNAGEDLDVEALALTKDSATPATTVTAAMSNETVIKAITDAIKGTNNDESVCPMNASKVQKFTILPEDFSVSTDELTPTFKLKRSVVYSKYAAAIDAMYSSKAVYVQYSA